MFPSISRSTKPYTYTSINKLSEPLNLFQKTEYSKDQELVLQKIKQSKTIDRSELTTYQSTLNHQSPLFIEINQKLVLFYTGIVELSNGIKVNMTNGNLPGGAAVPLLAITTALNMVNSFIPDGNSIRIETLQKQIDQLRDHNKVLASLTTHLASRIKDVEKRIVKDHTGSIANHLGEIIIIIDGLRNNDENAFIKELDSQNLVRGNIIYIINDCFRLLELLYDPIDGIPGFLANPINYLSANNVDELSMELLNSIRSVASDILSYVAQLKNDFSGARVRAQTQRRNTSQIDLVLEMLDASKEKLESHERKLMGYRTDAENCKKVINAFAKLDLYKDSNSVKFKEAVDVFIELKEPKFWLYLNHKIRGIDILDEEKKEIGNEKAQKDFFLNVAWHMQTPELREIVLDDSYFPNKYFIAPIVGEPKIEWYERPRVNYGINKILKISGKKVLEIRVGQEAIGFDSDGYARRISDTFIYEKLALSKQVIDEEGKNQNAVLNTVSANLHILNKNEVITSCFCRELRYFGRDYINPILDFKNEWESTFSTYHDADRPHMRNYIITDIYVTDKNDKVLFFSLPVKLKRITLKSDCTIL